MLAAVELASGPASADERWLQLSGDEALLAAPCPDPSSLDLDPVSPSRLAAARAGEFEVFGSRPSELQVPIDWSMDPLGARRFRQNLHKLRFLRPLLASYAATANGQDLSAALAIGLDWVEGNPRRDPRTPPEAWSDKVVGDRTPYLSYLLRAAACEDLASETERRRLLDSLSEHGRALASERTYVADNHGLFVDLGLVRLVAFFPFLAEAESWLSLARERFEATLRGRLSEGVWLEHSSAYEFLAIRPVEDLLDVLGADPELEALLEEMREAAGWFVRPDLELTQFGDSNLEPVPEWASEQVAERTGMRVFFDAGFAFVSAEGEAGDTGYLAVTDGFHNLTHKHADELSFELFDHGVSIVNDTGLYHKDPGEIRDFVVSNRAHSVLAVDGLDLPIDDPEATYGSGLTAAGEGEGWYAIEGSNPLLKPQGVRHRRLFLYRPGTALLIVDHVRSEASHLYTRYLHLHPDVELDASPDEALGLSAPGFQGRVYDLATDVESVRTEARGQEEVPLQGLTSPDFREFRPRWTVAYSDQAESELRVLSLALDDGGLHADAAVASRAGISIDLVEASGARAVLDVSRTERTLQVALTEAETPAG